MSTRGARSLGGVTLIELMIAVAVVAILTTIALPAYQSYRLKVGRTVGMQCLLEAQQRIESLYARNGEYPAAGAGLAAIGYADDPHACGDDGAYRLSLVVARDPVHYALTATPQGLQAGDGALLLDVIPRHANPNDRLRKRHRRSDGSVLPGWHFQPGR